MRGQGLLDDEIKQKLDNLTTQKKEEIEKLAKENIKASLGEFSNKNKFKDRFNLTDNDSQFNSEIAGDIY